ncbi:hypothetical protein, partial [Azospirillum himalayense]
LGSSIIDDHEKEEMEEAQRAAEARATQAEAERDAAQADALMDIAHALGCELDRAAALQAVVALQSALSASQAREAGLREALEPFLVAAAGMAEIDMPDDAAVLRASADWWLRSGEAGKKGRPLTFGDFRKLAALSHHREAQGGGNG